MLKKHFANLHGDLTDTFIEQAVQSVLLPTNEVQVGSITCRQFLKTAREAKKFFQSFYVNVLTCTIGGPLSSSPENSGFVGNVAKEYVEEKEESEL